MFTNDDPRSTLATAEKPAQAPPAHDGSTRLPQYIEFDAQAPTQTSAAGSPSWYFRGQNFVLALTNLEPGDVLERSGQAREYLVLLTEDSASVEIASSEGSAAVEEQALVVVSPGDSAITARARTAVIRLFDSSADDLMAMASNADAYAVADPRVTLLEPWPSPAGGHSLRVYYPERVEAQPGRFGRIYRTSSFMVNFIDPQLGPRDPEKLSPHHHDDFEQCSLAVEGEFLHHIRTPWTPRRSQWHDDEHIQVGSPSVAIIPPPTIHTTEAIGAGLNRLIDIFCPPREDFSAKDGWVLNSEEYPQP